MAIDVIFMECERKMFLGEMKINILYIVYISMSLEADTVL